MPVNIKKNIVTTSLLIKPKCAVSKEDSNNDTENLYCVIYKASIHLKPGIKYKFKISVLFIALIVMNSELFMLIIDIFKGDFVKSSTSIMFATPANEGRCASPYYSMHETLKKVMSMESRDCSSRGFELFWLSFDLSHLSQMHTRTFILLFNSQACGVFVLKDSTQTK